jgi:hypothetical protein
MTVGMPGAGSCGGSTGNPGSGSSGGNGGGGVGQCCTVPGGGEFGPGGGGGGGGFFGGGGGGGGGFFRDKGASGGGGGGGSGHLDSATTTGGSTGPGTNTGDGTVTITYPLPCPVGQARHLLTATTNVGTINGLFCVNPSTGIGTYIQDPVGAQPSVSGTGIVEQHPGTTQMAAFGTDLNLAGNQFGSLNRFAETAPVTAFGTFSLS